MPFNTLSVASAVTPSVIETYFSHFLHRSPLKNKPTAHISYHEGLRLIRQFLEYSSRHTVEDLQAFTAQWVPAPTWVKTCENEIAPQFLERSARIIQAQLGRRGIDKVGGATWWQWRRPEGPLKAEWIEMKKDFNERRKAGIKCDRCILYIHGGAYYFGSVDEHRYQMQRHARKLKARVLAPRYRLAPQFPFPCGLFDCLAAYLYLLEHFRPEQILFTGDSAGGGMVLSLLVTLRDQGYPLPAGTILLSPWVDLTHSFPSVAGDGIGDYIPPWGFHHKPSMAWPPPPSDELPTWSRKTFEQPPSDAVELPATAGVDMKKRKKRRKVGDEEISDDEESTTALPQIAPQAHNQVPGLGENLSITLDGEKIELKEQIQMYAPNDLLSHPMVSPVMQPSLGGLPPTLIQVGGAELLRDEQIYLAHKAANPKAFPPSDAVMREYDPRKEYLDRYPPTDVQLQIWEDLCHVPHTLSFTRPAKYMYRSVSQFGAWALAHAQHKGVEIRDNDDAVSIISSGPDEDGENFNASTTDLRRKKTNASLETDGRSEGIGKLSLGAVGRAGDPLPPFKDHMIRQRVTRHGVIYPLAPQSEIACLALDPASIGAIKPGPVRKWIAKGKETDVKFANDRKKIQKKRAKEMQGGYDEIFGECPPPSALVGRRRKGVAPEEKKRGKSWGLAMWSGWGSHHDENTLQREEKAEEEGRNGSLLQGPEAGSAQVQQMQQSLQPQWQDSGRPPASASGRSLAVPGRAEEGKEVVVDSATKKKRRTSSVSMLSAPWSQKEVVTSRDRPRSPWRQVTDTGQARTTTAPSAEGSPHPESSARIPFGRRLSSSTTSTSALASRPVSIAVPTAGALQPSSEPVPGSQNTFLDPNNSRPHNGINAYPFKLRSPGGNPSNTTLDSLAASGKVSIDGSSSRGIDAGNCGPVEMPTPADAHTTHEMPTPADERTKLPAPAPTRSPLATEEPVSAISPADERSVSPVRPDEEQVVSPVERAPQAIAPPVERIPQAMAPPAAPFMARNGIFDNRSSVLGAIGADGMPITPQLLQRKKTDEEKAEALARAKENVAARAQKKHIVAIPTSAPAPTQNAEENSGEVTPVTPVDGQQKAAFKTRNPAVEPRAAESDDSTPVTPVDGEKSSKPFKIRNPVFDSRAATPAPGSAAVPARSATPVEKPSPEQPSASAMKPGEATEATKAAPFKLRHTIYDPSAGFGTKDAAVPNVPSPSTTPDTSAPPTRAPSSAEKVAAHAMTPVEPQPPSAADLPPNANVVMPTVVARRPMAVRQNTPTPPPKDEARGNSMAGMDRKRSRELLSRERKTPSPVGIGALPTSKLGSNAPMHGDLSFEKERVDLGGERKGEDVQQREAR